MFDNIGGKIKNLATVICVIGIIASVILAIALWSQNDKYNPTVALGFGVLIGGCVGSWVGSFFMYGFGELIEETTRNRIYNEKIHKLLYDELNGAKLQRNEPKQPENETKKTWVSAEQWIKQDEKQPWNCKKCGWPNHYTRSDCAHCREPRE